MATRLYPGTENEAILEKLCGVPAGTAARMHEIKKPFQEKLAVLNQEFQTAVPPRQDEIHMEFSDIQNDEMDALEKDPDAQAFSSFLTFGFGHLTYEACQVLKKHQHDPEIGRSTSNLVVAEVLESQGIRLPEGVSVEDFEGINWN